MRTPRPSTRTLPGYGWLQEAPKNFWPRAWDIKSRSALRKCVFMPIPPDAQAFLNALPPPKPASPVPAHAGGVAHRPATPPFRRKDPKRDARLFSAVSPEHVAEEQRRRLYADAQARLLEQRPPVMVGNGGAVEIPGVRAWYEDPVALGTLLIVLPPIGLAALWISKRYSDDARWALTVMTGLTLCLATAIVIALSMFH